MDKLTFAIILSLSFSIAYSQQNILVFKNGNKTITRFWVGSFIAFQLKDNEWKKGEITKIQNDSIYIRPRIVHYNLMGTDTVYYNVEGFSVSDVFALPKKGVLIDYINGRFQISRSGGHIHWYWVKSGWIFRAGAIGYTGLNITNKIIDNSFSLSGSKLGIAAGVFLGGVLLHKTYKLVLRVRKKYHLEIFKLAD